MRKNRKIAFTLLEVIIVIIIVGVLTSLALPRFFRMIQFSYSAEAFSGLQSIRGAMERCYISKYGTYQTCNFSILDINPPDMSPNAHFEYDIASTTITGYVVQVTRKTRDGGSPTSTITFSVASDTITRSGTTVFSGIQ